MFETTAAELLKDFVESGSDEMEVMDQDRGGIHRITRVCWSESGADIIWVEYRDGLYTRTIAAAPSDTLYVR